MILVCAEPTGDLGMLHIVAPGSIHPPGDSTLVATTLCGRQLVVTGCREVELDDVDGALCFGCKVRQARGVTAPKGAA